ncbi:hypothetical protein [Rhodococcoides fascians]|uniref:hypothetical protein n=1 Tax=Rhodococcoides fascians TaxID=1828 RepID=UPI002787427C|nr:hypothetical protein [Rhodococcus fascians]MDQ0283776.1 hypothetical protein [Rhodococcus fascians]
MSDIIADIDALIDEQLLKGEPLNGYDYGDPHHPKCPHCHRDWHGLAITQRIEELRNDWQLAQNPSYSPLHCSCMWCQETFGQSDTITLEEATKALDEYRYATDDSAILCPGSDFIGPWATSGQLKKIRDGWPDQSPWSSLPLDPFLRRFAGSGDLERLLLWPNPMFPTTFEFSRPERRGASVTYSVVDETVSMARRWANSWTWRSPFIDAVPVEPRPWMWVPRERAFPAYTVEKTLRSRLWSAVWDTLGEHYELKITGTLPELVDATIETPGAIPWWATDVDTQVRMLDPSSRNRLIWGDRWGSRDFYLMSPRQNGLDARIASLARNWESNELTQWTATVGADVRADIACAAEVVQQVREEPPMWALDPGSRRNTRRRHR